MNARPLATWGTASGRVPVASKIGTGAVTVEPMPTGEGNDEAPSSHEQLQDESSTVLLEAWSCEEGETVIDGGRLLHGAGLSRSCGMPTRRGRLGRQSDSANQGTSIHQMIHSKWAHRILLTVTVFGFCWWVRPGAVYNVLLAAPRAQAAARSAAPTGDLDSVEAEGMAELLPSAAQRLLPAPACATSRIANASELSFDDLRRMIVTGRAGDATSARSGECSDAASTYSEPFREMLHQYARFHQEVRTALDSGRDLRAHRTLTFKCVRGYGGLGDNVKGLLTALLAALLAPQPRALFIDCAINFPLETVWAPCRRGCMSIDWRWDPQWDAVVPTRHLARALEPSLLDDRDWSALPTFQPQPPYLVAFDRFTRLHDVSISVAATLLSELGHRSIADTVQTQLEGEPYFQWLRTNRGQNAWYLLQSAAHHLWFTGNARVQLGGVSHGAVFGRSGWASNGTNATAPSLPLLVVPRLANWFLPPLQVAELPNSVAAAQRNASDARLPCKLYKHLPHELLGFVLPRTANCTAAASTGTVRLDVITDLLLNEWVTPTNALVNEVLQLAAPLAHRQQPLAVIGLHVRIGSQPAGATFQDPARNSQDDVPAFVACAEHLRGLLASRVGERPQTAWVIASDHPLARQTLLDAASARGILAVGGGPRTVMHIDRTRKAALNEAAALKAFIDAYAEMTLLSAVHALVRSKSGFSQTAQLWGNVTLAAELRSDGACTAVSPGY